MKENYQVSPHFTYEELACPQSGILKLAEWFLYDLEELRIAMDKSFHVNSCCRSKLHNEQIGGAANSFHLYENIHGTCAIDISIEKWTREEVARLIWLASRRSWSVGIADTFIHLDRRTDYMPSKPVFFSY